MRRAIIRLNQTVYKGMENAGKKLENAGKNVKHEAQKEQMQEKGKKLVQDGVEKAENLAEGAKGFGKEVGEKVKKGAQNLKDKIKGEVDDTPSISKGAKE